MTTAFRLVVASALILSATASLRASEGTPSGPSAAAARSGAEVFRAACVSCHAPDGKGQPQAQVGFDVPIPDFSDCAATTPEMESTWSAVIHRGGPARGFDRHMPRFGDALSEEEIANVVKYLRTFCADPSWPVGDLNLPRPLVTEKAFPENEAVLTTSVSIAGGASMANRFLYEHRLGTRSQWEVTVPIELQHPEGEGWGRGLGDVAAALKHVVFHDTASIFSVGGEVSLPTGKETQGLGKGVTLFEPFVAFGRILPADSFVQAQTGAEVSADRAKSAPEAFVRVATGRTLVPSRFGRAWTPMVEVLGVRELASGAAVEWDVVPQAQITLSRRQHVRLNAGLQIPVNEREGRPRTFHVYLLWDWFDGGFFSGW